MYLSQSDVLMNCDKIMKEKYAVSDSLEVSVTFSSIMTSAFCYFQKISRASNRLPSIRLRQASQGLPPIRPQRTACYLLANSVFWLLQLHIYSLIFSVIFPSCCFSNIFVPCLSPLLIFSFSILEPLFTSPFPCVIICILFSFFLLFSPR